MRDTRHGYQQCGGIGRAYLPYRAVAFAGCGLYGGSYRGLKIRSQAIAQRLRFAHGVSSDHAGRRRAGGGGRIVVRGAVSGNPFPEYLPALSRGPPRSILEVHSPSKRSIFSESRRMQAAEACGAGPVIVVTSLSTVRSMRCRNSGEKAPRQCGNDLFMDVVAHGCYELSTAPSTCVQGRGSGADSDPLRASPEKLTAVSPLTTPAPGRQAASGGASGHLPGQPVAARHASGLGGTDALGQPPQRVRVPFQPPHIPEPRDGVLSGA